MWLITSDYLFKAELQAVNDVVVRGLLVKLDAHHHTQTASQLSRHHAEKLKNLDLLQSLLQVVFELELGFLEPLVKVGPRQSLAIDDVD